LQARGISLPRRTGGRYPDSAHTFTEAIRIAANHSGDSDSTASIAGQLWGAMHGLEGMPHTWITALDVLQPLLRLARQLMPYV
jgi:ADP-ribosylglycohydrolase